MRADAPHRRARRSAPRLHPHPAVLARVPLPRASAASSRRTRSSAPTSAGSRRTRCRGRSPAIERWGEHAFAAIRGEPVEVAVRRAPRPTCWRVVQLSSGVELVEEGVDDRDAPARSPPTRRRCGSWSTSAGGVGLRCRAASVAAAGERRRLDLVAVGGEHLEAVPQRLGRRSRGSLAGGRARARPTGTARTCRAPGGRCEAGDRVQSPLERDAAGTVVAQPHLRPVDVGVDRLAEALVEGDDDLGRQPATRTSARASAAIDRAQLGRCAGSSSRLRRRSPRARRGRTRRPVADDRDARVHRRRRRHDRRTTAATTTTAHDAVATTRRAAARPRRVPPVPARRAPDPTRPRYQRRPRRRPRSQRRRPDARPCASRPTCRPTALVFRSVAQRPACRPRPVPASTSAAVYLGGTAPVPTQRPDPTTLRRRRSSAPAAAGDIDRGDGAVHAHASAADRRPHLAHAGDTMRLGSFLPLLAWEPGVGWATEPPTALHGEAATAPVADYDGRGRPCPPGYDVLAQRRARRRRPLARAPPCATFALAVGRFRRRRGHRDVAAAGARDGRRRPSASATTRSTYLAP